MSELDDFHASIRMALTAMRTRHIKNIRWMRRVQAALVFVNAGFFALDIIAGNICLAILALAAIIFGSAIIIQGTRAINRAERRIRKPDYTYIDRMDLAIYGRTFNHRG
jgi:hypothetical protein